MMPVESGRANLVIPCGTDWARTFTYFDTADVLSLVTATAARGAVSITVANGSAAPVTFTAGDLVAFAGDSGLYLVGTGATINPAASGTIVIEGTGLSVAAAAAVITQHVPMNLTGYTARMQIRATADAATAILSLTSSPAAGLTLGGAAGTITAQLTHTQLTEGASGLDLSSITAPEAWVLEESPDGSRLRGFGKVAAWDLELVDGSGNVTRLLKGQVVFDAEVTR